MATRGTHRCRFGSAFLSKKKPGRGGPGSILRDEGKLLYAPPNATRERYQAATKQDHGSGFGYVGAAGVYYGPALRAAIAVPNCAGLADISDVGEVAAEVRSAQSKQPS